MKNLGLVNKNIVVKVVKFYSYVKFINLYQQTEEYYRKTNRKSDFDQLYLDVLRKLLKNDISVFDDTFVKYKVM